MTQVHGQQHPLDDSFLETDQDDGVTVATIGFPTVREWQAAIIRERLKAVVEASGGRMALCLVEVDSLSAAFVHDLIQLSARCSQMGGRMVLFGVPRALREQLASAGLDRSLSFAPGREDAVAMFHDEPKSRRGGLFGWFGRGRAA